MKLNGIGFSLVLVLIPKKTPSVLPLHSFGHTTHISCMQFTWNAAWYQSTQLNLVLCVFHFSIYILKSIFHFYMLFPVAQNHKLTPIANT